MNLLEFVLNFFYPNVCGICEKICDIPICYNCQNKIKKELVIHRKKYIKTRNRHFDEHMYLFNYKNFIREKIINYKFKEKSYLYKTFSYIILENEKIISYINKYDYITCVPIHKNRKKSRGYNQSELIMKEVCKKNKNLILENDILIKVKDIKPQSSLNKENRKINIYNAYKVNELKKDLIKDKNILIFDDIFTTGSTVNECARILEANGAKRIGILTIARD